MGDLQMTPLEKRIATLNEYLEAEIAECGPDTLYAQDIRALIKDCENELKNVSKDGFRMVT